MHLTPALPRHPSLLRYLLQGIRSICLVRSPSSDSLSSSASASPLKMKAVASGQALHSRPAPALTEALGASAASPGRHHFPADLARDLATRAEMTLPPLTLSAAVLEPTPAQPPLPPLLV